MLIVRVFALAFLMTSCSSSREVPPSRAQSEAAAQQLTSENEDGSLALTPDGSFLDINGAYRRFAARVIEENPAGGKRLLDAARLNSQAFEQTRYPQLSPSVFLNEEGEPLARIGITQILFSNGQFKAEKESLRANEIEALANYLIDTNQLVADAFNAYFDAELHGKLAQSAKELEGHFAGLKDQAQRRVEGGVGDETEVATFSLRELNARSDFLDNQALQRLAERRIDDFTGGLNLPTAPPHLKPVKPAAQAPEIVLLLAQFAGAQSRVNLERARRRPNFSLEAFADTNIRTGEANEGATIGAGLVVPLGFRNGLGVEAAEAELAAIELDLEAGRRDLERRVQQLRARIAQERAQIPTLRELARLSEERIENFEQQFLSGSVSIEEAVSVLETFNRSQTQLIESEIEILRSETEIARLQGQLLPAGN